MLSEPEIRAIEHELPHYPQKRAVSIEALKIVQRHRGWVSDEALADLAAYLDVSIEDLDGVATFYNLIFRRPVGDHVVLVCDSVSCWICGHEDLLAHFRERWGVGLGQTTADGRFTLLSVPCLGACDRAPVVMIDGDTHFDLTPERLDEVLERYPANGKR